MIPPRLGRLRSSAPPKTTAGATVYASAAAKARRSLIDHVVDERAIIFGTHFAGSSALHLEMDGSSPMLREVPPRAGR